MSGIDVVACVAAIIAAFQGGADATKRIQTQGKKKKKAGVKALENELQLSMEKGRDELIRSKAMFVSDCGYIVPGEEPYLYYVEQLYEAKSSVESIRMLLNMLYDNESPLKDPSRTREDADRWRWVAVQALRELRMRIMASGASQPMPSSPPSAYPHSTYTHPSPPAQDSRRAPPVPQNRPFPQRDMSPSGSVLHVQPLSIPRSRADADPPSQIASSPPASQMMQPPHHMSQDTGAVDMSWNGNPLQQESRRPPVQQTLSSDSNRSRAPTWASEETSNSLPDKLRGMSLSNMARALPSTSLVHEPSNPPLLSHSPTSDSHRGSVATFQTSSSGNSNEIVPIQPESRRPSSLLDRFSSSRRKSRGQQGTIEHAPGEVTSNASARNDWHGFCRGTFEISEDLSNGLEIVQRPFNLHSTKLFLQCKRCAFPGVHAGQSSKTKMPDNTVMTSARGIRYRWMFLAKCHVKSTDSSSGVINVAEQTKKNAYRCNFCYLEGTLPDKLGGIETLMNHIWQHHRRKGMSDHVRKRAGCIIGRVADSYEAFDINIPSFEEDSASERFTKEPGDVIFAGSADVAAQAIGLGVKSDHASDTIPGVCVGVTELPEMGRRGSPIELPGSQSYLTQYRDGR